MAAAVLALGILAFTACGGSSDAYTIYLKDANGNAIANQSIGICHYDENGNQIGCLLPKNTDADGKVVFDANDGADEEKVWKINQDTIDSYTPQETYEFTSFGEYTVVLIAK